MQDETNAQTELLAAKPEIHAFLDGAPLPARFLENFARAQQAQYAAVFPTSGSSPLVSWREPDAGRRSAQPLRARFPVMDGTRTLGYVELAAPVPLDVARQVSLIDRYNREWIALRDGLRNAKRLYTMVMILITLFVLFVATWIALFLAKQISVPITALLDAASEVRKGNLKHRVEVRAVDELALLVRGFNQMTAGAGSQQPRARPAPPLHRSHPRKHSHRRHFHRRRRLHQARQPRAGQNLPRRSRWTKPPAWRTCSRARTPPKSST